MRLSLSDWVPTSRYLVRGKRGAKAVMSERTGREDGTETGYLGEGKEVV